MNILYCGDEGIARGVLVSVLSLLENGKKKYAYEIVDLAREISEEK